MEGIREEIINNEVSSEPAAAKSRVERLEESKEAKKLKRKEKKPREKKSGGENRPEDSGKSKKGIIAVMIIVILLALLAGYRIMTNYFQDDEESVETIINVKTAVAEIGDIYLESPVTAKLEAKEEVAVVPLAAGKVTSVGVKVGDYVKQGTVLFKIDDTQIQSSITQAREACELARTTFERIEYLYSEGVVSQQDYESTKAQYTNAELAYSSALESASYYTVTAPISGYVTVMDVSVGSVAGQSMAAAIADTSQLVINAKVAENLAGKINVGDRVDIYVSSLNKTFGGSVTTASKVPSIGTVTYPVTISVNDPENELMAGMFAEVRIKTAQEASALIVPSESVIVKGGETIVVTLDGNIPEFNPVEVGIDNGEYAEILSGIKAGDVIVVAGQHYVEEGKEVRIVE
ncbi:MAG: efflux RND transporter periplasmic adaptor subunit [Bacillota bacterium]|nr:efflux RND transporter periplasmic adaptor subunit [Bacillota bacterium]